MIYDQTTLDAAEHLVRTRIQRTRFASDARLLKVVADEIHGLASPTTIHHVIVLKEHATITADCLNCDAGFESQGHDESSRMAVARWVKTHEGEK